MPHLRLEYAVSTDDAAVIETLVTKLHAQMVASSVFPTAGIRVRAFKADHAIVADGDVRNGFVAMQLSVGAGRSTEVLKVEGDQLFSDRTVLPRGSAGRTLFCPVAGNSRDQRGSQLERHAHSCAPF